MSSATPWWGTLVVAIIGLGGLLVSQWLTNRRERNRIDLEQRERALQRRIDSYSEFLASLQQTLDVADAAGVKVPNQEKLDDAWSKLSSQYYRIRLIGPKEVTDGVTKLVRSLRAVVSIAQRGIHQGAEIESARSQFGEAFVDVAPLMRKDVSGDEHWIAAALGPDEATLDS